MYVRTNERERMCRPEDKYSDCRELWLPAVSRRFLVVLSPRAEKRGRDERAEMSEMILVTIRSCGASSLGISRFESHRNSQVSDIVPLYLRSNEHESLFFLPDKYDRESLREPGFSSTLFPFR